MSETSEAPNQSNTVLTKRLVRWMQFIAALLTIIVVLGGGLAILANAAADVTEIRAELVRIERDMIQLETRLESALSAMNPVLLEIQSRLVRIETQLEMALKDIATP